MKTSPKAIASMILVLLGLLASEAALAQHRGHGHRHGGRAHIGLYLGVPIYAAAVYPWYYTPYYPRPYYYPPAVIVNTPPPVYIEQGAVQAAPTQAQTHADWYYCAASRAYYPEVGECVAGWQRVPAQPPSR